MHPRGQRPECQDFRARGLHRTQRQEASQSVRESLALRQQATNRRPCRRNSLFWEYKYLGVRGPEDWEEG